MSGRNSSPGCAIVWFRRDLRLADNPALQAAAATGLPVVPIFIHDDEQAAPWQPGPASRWWLRGSLAALRESLHDKLLVTRGDPLAILPDLAAKLRGQTVFWNRGVEPWRTQRDDTIKERLAQDGVQVRSFNGNYLFDPPTIRKKDGTPYRVFTPFYRHGCLKHGRPPRHPVAAPSGLRYLPDTATQVLDEERLLPTFGWFSGPTQQWQPGEDGGREALAEFLDGPLEHYARDRDRPDRHGVSRLAPHLHFGELSPNQVWHAVRDRYGATELPESADRFLTELGWRDFCAYQLYHEPSLTDTNMQRHFDRFPWQDDNDLRDRWQRGMTGYPIVDAGMRELSRTGFMHNRVRMVAASFLVKNLLQDWRHGARWFWNRLLDADLASNAANWQWVAGCGADAAPYFRIFNPVTQGKKFDPEGTYVRCFVPELAELPDRYIHEPWAAPPEVLAAAGIRLGKEYPQPVVDLRESRERALAAYRTLSRRTLPDDSKAL